MSLGALLGEGGCVTEARGLRHWGKGDVSLGALLGEGGCVTEARGLRHWGKGDVSLWETSLGVSVIQSIPITKWLQMKYTWKRYCTHFVKPTYLI